MKTDSWQDTVRQLYSHALSLLLDTSHDPWQLFAKHKVSDHGDDAEPLDTETETCFGSAIAGSFC